MFQSLQSLVCSSKPSHAAAMDGTPRSHLNDRTPEARVYPCWDQRYIDMPKDCAQIAHAIWGS